MEKELYDGKEDFLRCTTITSLYVIEKIFDEVTENNYKYPHLYKNIIMYVTECNETKEFCEAIEFVNNMCKISKEYQSFSYIVKKKEFPRTNELPTHNLILIVHNDCVGMSFIIYKDEQFNEKDVLFSTSFANKEHCCCNHPPTKKIYVSIPTNRIKSICGSPEIGGIEHKIFAKYYKLIVLRQKRLRF